MPRWKLRMEERAESEARSAFLWYLARNPRAAERFEAAVEECIDAIVEAPERFPETYPGSEGGSSSAGFPTPSFTASSAMQCKSSR